MSVLMFALIDAPWNGKNIRASSTTTAYAVCGQILYRGAEGKFIHSPYRDAASPRWVGPSSTVNNLIAGVDTSAVLVQISDDCQHGTQYSIQPAGIVSIYQEIPASLGGGVVALRLVGHARGKATLVLLSGRYKGWRLPISVVGVTGR